LNLAEVKRRDDPETGLPRRRRAHAQGHSGVRGRAQGHPHGARFPRPGGADPGGILRDQVPLEQLAIIRAPEPNLLTIQPYDPKALPEIERAILKSDLGLTPSNDGRIIRLVLPRLTEQRRQELVKLVHKRLEETRVAIRNIRRDALEELRARHKNKEMSDDELEEAKEEVQKLTDRYIEEAEKVAQAKEKEIMSF
jgi:ribosome recycling factor